ncbi:TIGR03668 family PPOX class F420-dependent oxidoreductase [Amycolatopsis sp.]|jgi:PPOX class probable F420-dependent enzyme|uniref:TIGR03668 family PPOX class F420-dependent oxidoreductase n=1 Tax=Amycolatopsis sp. TaxID=37632 RepID=UPI002E04027E|nr:TIGR03668 family PPOX class F420-dependent oxidoreductase [Amycolatopsis sp.]
MRLGETAARQRFVAARVARLATSGADGVPHLVPVTFAVVGDEIVFAIDHKPKSTTDLRRLRNIEANSAVSFLADEYDEDWARLWWVRADGVARILSAAADRAGPVRRLREKYPQYRDRPPAGVVVATTVSAWHGWSGSAP